MIASSIETQVCNRLHKLRTYIKSKVGTGEVAEDLYGEAVLKILRKVKSEKLRNDFPSLDVFMYLCAKSVISDYFIKEGRKKRNCTDEYGHYCEITTESPERAYEASVENKAFMEKARMELNDICRKVLVLLLFQNMKHWEIADTLGISRATVSTHIFRMRSSLGGVHLNQVRKRKSL